MSAPVITIDGPGGVGKGTLCRLLARRLGWHMLDSGVFYRLTALGTLRHGIAADDRRRVTALARTLDVEFTEQSDGELKLTLEGDVVSDLIRDETIGNLASQLAAIPDVRTALLHRQREFRRAPGLVADGRDMGTVVFPDAGIKLFLTASAEERAKRRYKQLKEKGISASLAALIRDITERDDRDANRPVAPLRPAADAERMDTTGLGIEQVTDQALAIIRRQFETVSDQP